MKRSTTFLSLLTIAAVTGCVGDTGQGDPAEVAAVQEALELDDGGFDTADAAPMFGEEAAFAEAGLDLEDPAIGDPIAAYGPDGAPAPDADEARAINVLVLWGQLRVDRDVESPRRWDGDVATTVGGLVLRRAIRFEDPTDAVLPRTDPQSIAFTSVTGPHHDGLLVSLVPPRLPEDGALPPEGEPELTISLAGLEDIVITTAQLAEGYRTAIPVDDERNFVVVTTLPNHPCPDGVLAGIWRHVGRGYGTFRGRWMGEGGELRGHVQGLWGTNRAGRQIFFGKYIGNAGEFRGLLRGVWGDGAFTGVFVDRDGAYRGGLRGDYGMIDAAVPGDGLFGGHWVEACEAEGCGPDGECPGLDPSVPGADELPE